MKRVILSIIIISLCFLSFVQVPESFNYQVILRYLSGRTYPDQPMKVRISNQSGSPTGGTVRCETFDQTTTSIGLLNLQIGKWPFASVSFTTTNWGSNSFYLKVEVYPTGVTSYVEMGTTQFLSIPYALPAKTVANFPETYPLFVALNKSNL